MDDGDDLEIMVANQRLELEAASATYSDLDLAFHLQMQEAMAASLALHPSSSSSAAAAVSPLPTDDETATDLSRLIAIQTLELDRFHQEKQDTELCQAEHRHMTENLRRLSHDLQLARDIQSMPNENWDRDGDNFQRPMEIDEEDLPFRLYFKGIVNRERGLMSGVGVAVCDPDDNLILKIQKPLPATDVCGEVIEVKALIEGLNAVISLGIKKVNVYYDHRALYNHVIGRWAVKQRKVANLIPQVSLLQRKIESCAMYLLPRCQVRFVFQLARDVIDSQVSQNVNLKGDKDLMENCNICLEVTDSSQIFTVDGCLHRYCFSCMKQHVEVKLLQGMLPGCPHVGCNIKLSIESSRKFLSPKLFEIMIQRVKEASIPATEKVYCPYPKCSALMSISEAICPLQDSSSKQSISDTRGLRKCIKCSGSLCIYCKVPWHDRMSCYDYKKLNPNLCAEDAGVQSLARQKLWRQCVKCNHMIELAEGCFHMTCRCGYEFCYTCGAEWKDKKATCSCPLWDEGNIMHDRFDENPDFDDDDDDWDEDEDYDDDYDDLRYFA